MSYHISKSLKDLRYNKDKVDPVTCFRCKDCSELHPVLRGRKYRCRKVHQTHPIPDHGRWWYNEVHPCKYIYLLDERIRVSESQDSAMPISQGTEEVGIGLH